MHYPIGIPPSDLCAEDRSLLRQVRRCAVSRAEIAARTGLSRNTVTARLARLEAAGWVVESAETKGERGRPFVRYGLNPLAALIFSARFDAAEVHAAVCALTGEVLARESRSVPPDLGPDLAVHLLCEMIDRMTQGPAIRRDRLALSVIGVPGPVSDRTRTIAWSRVGVLPADLSARLGIPTLVENDANLMALGAARDLPAEASLLFILVQSGIGAGLVLNGRLHRGIAGWAGEVGHVPVAAAAGLPCGCGNTGCIAIVADMPALMRRLSRPERPVATLGALRQLILASDVEAVMALRQAGRNLGEALTSLVVGLAPEVIMVGGSVAEVGAHLASGLRESLAQRTPSTLSALIRVTTAEDHAACATRGSADLALDHLLGPSLG